MSASLAKHLSGGSMPVPLADVAEARRIVDVAYRPMLADGGLQLTNTGFIMLIDPGSHDPASLREQFESPGNRGRYLPARIRFTIAHEIAHTFFYRVDGGRPAPMFDQQDARSLPSLESACNHAAAELLIPTEHLNQDVWHWHALSIENVESVAKRFGVSMRAAMYRFSGLQSWALLRGAILHLSKRTDGWKIEFAAADACGRLLLTALCGDGDVQQDTILPLEQIQAAPRGRTSRIVEASLGRERVEVRLEFSWTRLGRDRNEYAACVAIHEAPV